MFSSWFILSRRHCSLNVKTIPFLKSWLNKKVTLLIIPKSLCFEFLSLLRFRFYVQQLVGCLSRVTYLKLSLQCSFLIPAFFIFSDVFFIHLVNYGKNPESSLRFFSFPSLISFNDIYFSSEQLPIRLYPMSLFTWTITTTTCPPGHESSLSIHPPFYSQNNLKLESIHILLT